MNNKKKHHCSDCEPITISHAKCVCWRQDICPVHPELAMNMNRPSEQEAKAKDICAVIRQRFLDDKGCSCEVISAALEVERKAGRQELFDHSFWSVRLKKTEIEGYRRGLEEGYQKGWEERDKNKERQRGQK